jgi:hypothetical protein
LQLHDTSANTAKLNFRHKPDTVPRLSVGLPGTTE